MITLVLYFLKSWYIKIAWLTLERYFFPNETHHRFYVNCYITNLRFSLIFPFGSGHTKITDFANIFVTNKHISRCQVAVDYLVNLIDRISKLGECMQPLAHYVQLPKYISHALSRILLILLKKVRAYSCSKRLWCCIMLVMIALCCYYKYV